MRRVPDRGDRRPRPPPRRGERIGPDRVQPPAGHAPYLLAHAVGVQVYACATTADGPKWQFVEPRPCSTATAGSSSAPHYVGPTWKTKDGSHVKAARVDGVTVDPTAIPWLLLKATRDHPAAARRTTYIQRLATAAGSSPPRRKCHAGTVGRERWVPYTADYRFWKEQS